jgi:hypothetical protein
VKNWHWLLIGVASIIVMWQWRFAMDTVTLALNDGIIPTLPVDLAASAGVDIDQYSLARAMQSEESSTDGRTAIGWAIKNHCVDKSITSVVTANPKNPACDGHYSKEMPGKYCSTAHSPSSATLDLAASIISGEIPDLTGGATFWDGPAAQDAAHARDPEKYTRDWAAQEQFRLNQGYSEVTIPGVETVFWKRA